jgi:hypothetical protein
MFPTFTWRVNNPDPGDNLFMGHFFVGPVIRIAQQFPRLPQPWKAWVRTGRDGTTVGYYNTEAEAKDALINAAIVAMMGVEGA